MDVKLGLEFKCVENVYVPYPKLSLNGATNTVVCCILLFCIWEITQYDDAPYQIKIKPDLI